MLLSTFIIKRALHQVRSLHYFSIEQSSYCTYAAPAARLWSWSSMLRDLCSFTELGPLQMNNFLHSDTERLPKKQPFFCLEIHTHTHTMVVCLFQTINMDAHFTEAAGLDGRAWTFHIKLRVTKVIMLIIIITLIIVKMCFKSWNEKKKL